VGHPVAGFGGPLGAIGARFGVTVSGVFSTTGSTSTGDADAGDAAICGSITGSDDSTTVGEGGVTGWGDSTGATGASISAAAENCDANASLVATCWSLVGKFGLCSTAGSGAMTAGSTNGCPVGCRDSTSTG